MIHKHLRVMAFATAATVCPSIFAATAESTTSLDSQRSLFTAIEKQLKKKKTRLFFDNLEQLKDYPLLPYLEWMELNNRLSALSQQDIDHYVSTYSHSPHTYKIQRQWLDQLAKSHRWEDYLMAYERSDINNARYQCFNGVALYKQGNKQKAWDQAAKLWLIGKSQNKACDPLFSLWKKAGELTQELAFERFWLAAAKGNLQLARYIDKAIQRPGLKKNTQLFWSIHNNPRLLATTKALDKMQEKHRFIFLHGLKRLARRNISQASTLWLATRDSYPFSLNQVARLDQWLSIRLAKSFHNQADHYIEKLDPLFSYPEVTEWRIRLALADQNWGKVTSLIARLPDNYLDKSRWRYWQGVAALNIANNKSTEGRQKVIINTSDFSDLSQERGFYGFLVADINNAPFQLNQSKVSMESEPLQQLISEFDALQRIREWLYHGRYYQAQSELNQLKPALNPEQRKGVAYLAHQWDWHHQAIMTAAREALWNELDLRFPTPQADLFRQFSRQRELDSSWLVAIARQESAFNPTARSHAGARGLMQLMPGTARQTARHNKITYKKASDLYQPRINIALGAAHLAELIDRFENNRVFATAAYNAGSRRVSGWLKQRGHLPLDIWIETIPYDETRQYVQNVLAFRVIYKTLKDVPVRMLSTKEAAMLTLSSLNRDSLSLSSEPLIQ
ncbi:transglycosylase SLT domain-containing protein [Endozoicomonas sp. Mp262]|uniref:transglycosylase SLT domain-containing protein n=1 Tax=Endozoicomonas sp. Mp262 TaxID=2919499 RepID=UPI0021D8AF50